MANVKINGIVIAENNMGDYDKMLTILTPNYGKISCVAKGARRPQSALLAGTQLFCFGEYMMYKGTNTYHINSCETIEIFYNLRTDLSCLPHTSHLNPLSLIENLLKFFSSLQLTHFVTLGIKPKIHKSRILNTLNTKSLSFSVSEIVYKVFKNSCKIL
jgi:hypothetical protein